MRNRRINFFLDLIKLAARREDIEALRGILEFKYPGDRRIPGFAVQYYEKFIKGKNISTPLTEEYLLQPLPETIEEFLTLLQATETVKRKTKKEEYAEAILLKHPNIDLTNLNEDYLSWLHQRYIENKIKSGEIVHPIEEALVTLRKFTPIQDKYKASPEFRAKLKEADYEDISSIQELTLDEMENIISLDTSGLTVRVEGVKTKPEEFLGKFGEWNLWLPHTKETSVKIAGYDESYNPKTTWCTARTRGSNLFYDYIGRKDIPTFLFYIIKDNPKTNQDWLSLGYISQGNRLAPDFSGTNGGLSVDRANRGLREDDYSRILGDSWNSIKSRIEIEIEKHKIIEGGREKYVSPARSIIKALAKNVEEFKKELKPKSNEERKNFIEVIMDSDPSDEVLAICGETLAKIDSMKFLSKFSDKLWGKPYLDLARRNAAEKSPISFLSDYSKTPWAQPYIDLAASNAVEKDSHYFLYFSEEPWAKPYMDLAAKNAVEKDPRNFIYYFSDMPWAKNYLGLAAKIISESEPKYFLLYYLEKPWAQPYIDLAAKNLTDKDPYGFLYQFSNKPWAKSYIDSAAKNTVEKRPKDFINYFSEEPWAKPYLGLAARILAERYPYELLGRFSEKYWTQPYVGLAAKNLAEGDPYEFLLLFSEKFWAEPYIGLAARNAAEKKPYNFLISFSEKFWAQPYIELAKSKLEEKKASNSIQNKLLKLSSFLKSNNLKEYNYLNYYIEK